MKSILCYGDSNTWGYQGITKTRFPYETRYTGVMQNTLGKHYLVIEEGLNGRTTCFPDPIMPYRNGLESLPVILLTHMPIDLFIIMLGTNDTKIHLGQTDVTISKGMKLLVAHAQNPAYGPDGQPPQILIVSPIEIGSNILEDNDSREFDLESAKKAAGLAKLYQAVADEMGCHFLNAATYARPCAEDAIHMDEQSHCDLGSALSKKVMELLG